MSAKATKLLVLGVVMLFEPANGYQLRRELLSWSVDEWANIKPGSIYSMLKGLASQGLIARHDLVNGSQRVAVYTISDHGREEFDKLLHDAITTPEDGDQADFHAALSFLPTMRRASFLVALSVREQKLRNANELMRSHLDQMQASGGVPPHVVATFGLQFALLTAEADWLTQFIGSIEAGKLSFVGEPPDGWEPGPDDPGWRMAREREHYLRLIAGQH